MTVKKIFVFFSFLVAVFPQPSFALSDKIYDELSRFSKIIEIVDKYYVDEVDDRKAIIGAIQGMLSSLDPHTVYLSKQTYKDFKSDTQGRFGGIGIEVGIRDGILTVVSPLEGTPASQANIKAGDKILTIDGKSTKNMNLIDAVHLMRGPVGKKVALSVWSAGKTRARTVVLKREVIKVKSVKTKDLGDNVGLFRVVTFQDGTAKSLKKAIDKFKSEHNGELKGIVLDLRDNPGGLLNEAAKMVDYFVSKGVIVSTKGRDKVVDVKKAHRLGTLPKYPLIVMINHGSASASEIVAGALKDHNRAKLIGSRSYGKGSVQTVINLDEGDAIKITIAKYFTPKNKMIDGKGIQPDVLLDLKAYKKTLKPKKKGEKIKISLKKYREYQEQEALRIIKSMS